MLDVWGTNGHGLYENVDPSQPDYNLRGRFRSGADGGYDLWTVKPVSYPIPDDGPVGDLLAVTGRHNMRPAHFHVIASADGYQSIVTELYTDDDPYLGSDAVFGVKPSLVVHYNRIDSPRGPPAVGRSEPYWDLELRLHPHTRASRIRSDSARDAGEPSDKRSAAKPDKEGLMASDTAVSGTVQMPAAFARTSLPGRIIFGDGAIGLLAGELDQRDLRRAMLIAARHDASLAAHGATALGDRVKLRWDEVRQHVPLELAAAGH